MAKYLDELGLSQLWAKIKGTFVKNTPGRGLVALTGNQATTHEGTWIQDSSWSSTDNSTNPYRFIINYPIHVAPGETISIIGFINDASGFDSTKAVVYSATAPKQPMGDGSGSSTWTNNSSTTTAVILGYLSNNTTVATKVGLKYTLGVDYGDYTILALDQATDTKLGGVTLTDYVSAHTNSGVESGIAVTPKAIVQAINNANGVLKVDNIITGNPTVETTTAPSGGTIVYNSTTKKFLYAVTDGSTTTYYNNGGDLSNYGTKTDTGVSPTEGKIYIKDDYIYIWNGTDLKKVSGEDTFGIVSINGRATLEADAPKDVLEINTSDGIFINTDPGNDTFTIGLNVSTGSTIGGLKATPGTADVTENYSPFTNYTPAPNSQNQVAHATYPVHIYTSNDENKNLGYVGINAVTSVANGLMTPELYNDITVLKSTVSAAFQYTVRTALPTSIGTGTNAPDQRPADPASLATETYARMKVIYLVPIINAHDADSSSPNASANGDYQTYAEYVLVSGTGTATDAIGPNKKYTWERLGTTDVNIDAITTTYIENLN